MPARSAAAMALLWLVLVPAARAQAPDDTSARAADSIPSRWQINLRVAETGLSFGNSTRHNGLRINFQDHALERITGVNLTLWKPADDVGGRVHGLALGLIYPQAGTIAGIGVGPGVVAEDRLIGLAVGILGAVSGGDALGITVGGLGAVSGRGMTGVNVGGLGIVAGRGMTGINVGGLGAVAGRQMDGLNVAGLGAVAGTSLRGLSIGGLAVVGGEDARGVNLGGLGVVGGGELDGIHVAGLAAVAGGRVRWLSIAGLAVVGGNVVDGVAATLGAVAAGEDVRGLAVAGFRVTAPRHTGVMAALGYTLSREHRGISIATYNETRGPFRGLAIGLVNNARELHGVQVGIVNIARNNRGLARVLPLINIHLD